MGTSNGSDQEQNSCGVSFGHAYAVLDLFVLTETSGKTTDMFMIRNPWGEATYSAKWNAKDPLWTDELVAQVPKGVDPRTSTDETGVFVMPKELFKGCFEEFLIAHTKGDSYSDNWYDAIDMDNSERKYIFTPPAKDGDMYVTVETYGAEIVPSTCTTGPDPNAYYEGDMISPLVNVVVSKGVENEML